MNALPLLYVVDTLADEAHALFLELIGFVSSAEEKKMKLTHPFHFHSLLYVVSFPMIIGINPLQMYKL